jgi:hypothetical protein
MWAMKSFNLNFYLLGDFNLRDCFILPLLTSLEGMLLRQIIQEPTTKDKRLDLIIVNNFDSIISSDVYDASLGDHLLTECTINALKPKPKKKIISFRAFENIHNEFMADLSTFQLPCSDNPNQQLDFVASSIHVSYSRHAPLINKLVTVRSIKKFVSPSSKALMKERDSFPIANVIPRILMRL